MLDNCEQQGCKELVDIDPWIAFTSEYADIPYMCNTHIKPFEPIIRDRFRARRERKGQANE
jgi:hypothetical protein